MMSLLVVHSKHAYYEYNFFIPCIIMYSKTFEDIPFAFAKRHGVIVTEINTDDKAVIAHRAGLSLAILQEVRRYLACAIVLQPYSDAEFERLLTTHYEQQANQSMQMMEGLGDDLDLFEVAQQLAEPEDLLESNDDAPIIRLINALLSEAIKENASDIHIEPFESRLVVRLRVDGVLREILSPRRVLAPLLVSRIKVMAKLDIAEKRLPQDGRISLRIAGRAVDVRVSTIPSGNGERVVLRLLDKQAGRLELDHIGMPEDSLEQLKTLLKKPHGVILVTGPTGSGKTTSLYAMLNYLNDQSRNIMTVEDPIEYYLDGIGQTQVNSKVDMTFSRGLRAILRQDPDTVMVGEIRDTETADIAVQASLTGHAVLSTLHTNTAIGAVMRLRDMGVEPFLLASSLIGVMSQRLVRLLCPECKKPYQSTEHNNTLLGLDKSATLYAPVGCDACNFIGYRGRSGVYELIPIDSTLRTLIHDGAGQHQLEDHAHKQVNTLYQHAIEAVLTGQTSIEELLRVTQEG